MMDPETTILYLAGPMSGRPAFNVPAFDEAREALRAFGYGVVCPAELDRKAGFDELVDEWTPELAEAAARRDLRALSHVDGVAVLRGFTKSTGARAELTVARWIGLPVVAAGDVTIDLTAGVDAWLAGALPADVLAYEQGIRFPDNVFRAERVVLERTDAAQAHHDKAVDYARRLVGLDAWLSVDDPDDLGGLTPPDKADEEPATSPRRELLTEAADLVDGDRNAQYGDPRQDFARTATMWGAYLGTDVEPHDVAALMALLKVSRLKWSPGKRDSWVDLAGYAACGWHCAEELEQ
jgi:nucleoside 2-deoxyribosyltransferase